MNVKLKGICRGSEKIFFRCQVTPPPADGCPPKMEVQDDERRPLPGLLMIPKQGDASPGEFIGCLPGVETKHYQLRFLNCGEQGTDETSLRLSSERAKWESRINYRINKELADSIRDFDKEAAAFSAEIQFHDCIEDVGENILRGCVIVPYAEDNDIEIGCFTQDMESVPLRVIKMGDTKAAAGSIYATDRRLLGFSVRFPKQIASYLFVVRDKNHPEYDSFDMLIADEYQKLFTNSFDTMRNAQFDSYYYPVWYEKHRASEGALQEQRDLSMPLMPLFSIVVPLYNTPVQYFKDMLRSVIEQSYAKWELILVNASPENEELSSLVEKAANRDNRVRQVALGQNGGISENTNAGLDVAKGDYVCFFDHDDVLERDVLFEYARAINDRPDTDVLYCDEDKLLPDGTLSQPFFKPDFNIDLLRNNNYICHMMTIRRSLLEKLPRNTREFDGAQDHNLVLNAVEHTQAVCHIPKILYHWRVSESSTAGEAGSKSYASDAGVKAVQSHLDRLGLPASVSLSRRPFTYRVVYDVPRERPLVSIVIPTKDHIDMLDRCVRSILEKTTYDRYEIILVENNSVERETFAYYERLVAEHPQVVRLAMWEKEFNFSKLVNFGRANAKGEYLLLLNNDTEVITNDWLEILVGLCSREDVGAVGVRLYYPDDTIQHAGVVIAGGVASLLDRNLPRGNWGYFALNDAQQDLSAVTAACVMTSCADYDSVGGFTEELAVAFNDIDYCLKLREAGKLVVYTPEVELYHYESVSRGVENSDEKKIRFHREFSYMNYRWAEYYVKGDPYSNVNLTRIEPRSYYHHLE